MFPNSAPPSISRVCYHTFIDDVLSYIIISLFTCFNQWIILTNEGKHSTDWMKETYIYHVPVFLFQFELVVGHVDELTDGLDGSSNP